MSIATCKYHWGEFKTLECYKDYRDSSDSSMKDEPPLRLSKILHSLA